MNSTHNKGKSVIPERFIETVSKNVYIDKLTDIVNKFNNTFHNTIKIKTIHLNSRTYFDFGI